MDTAKRRVALVVSILKGETSVAEAARKHGLMKDSIKAFSTGLPGRMKSSWTTRR
jgi:hypothetical protein